MWLWQKKGLVTENDLKSIKSYIDENSIFKLTFKESN